MLEINPLFKAADDKIVAVDCKMNLDENALMRHPDLSALRDVSEEDPTEVEAGKFNLNFVKLDGNVGCMVNGAGLAMATMDMIKLSGGEPANFELKLEMKLEGQGANGGVQYRSFHVEPNLSPVPDDVPPAQGERRRKQLALDQKHAKWNLSGYQADFDFANKYTGQLYEQSSPRGIIAWRGQVVATEPGKKPTLLALLGTGDEMKAFIKPGEWNQVEIIADGNMLTHIINGHIMSVLVDTDSKYSRAKGVIALEIEGPGDLKIRHRNIWLKNLP